MALTGEQQQINEENEFILSLPREIGLSADFSLCLFQDFWCSSKVIQGVLNVRKYFNAEDSDVVVASIPKSGTTWLKALTFAILNHQRFPSFENHPLLTSNPHELVPFLELIFSRDFDGKFLSLSNMSEPRILGIHIPYPSLPESIKESDCKIIYICRNPFDTFVSAWEFFPKSKFASSPTFTLEEAFEKYCNGIVGFGPWWSHMVGYWKESIARPNKVLFLKYEDLKEDTEFHVRRIIGFLGCSISEEEGESSRVIQSIIKVCSFEKMKEANKLGDIGDFVDKKHFFRKGETGDWINYFSPSMVEKLSKIVEEKLAGTGLSFKMNLQITN